MWIAHVFSCINVCLVLRKLFEHEADRGVFKQLLSDRASSVNAVETTLFYDSSYLYQICTKYSKTSKIRTSNFSKY